LHPTGTNDYIYGPSLSPIEQINISSSTPSYLLADDLGSVRLMTDASGDVTGSFTYDAWGNVTGSSGSASSPFGYAGYYLDATSGLYYLQARWYDAGTGQFLSVDPAVMSTESPFAYASDDPVNGVDRAGTITTTISAPVRQDIGCGKTTFESNDAIVVGSLTYYCSPPRTDKIRWQAGFGSEGMASVSGPVSTFGTQFYRDGIPYLLPSMSSTENDPYYGFHGTLGPFYTGTDYRMVAQIGGNLDYGFSSGFYGITITIPFKLGKRFGNGLIILSDVGSENSGI